MTVVLRQSVAEAPTIHSLGIVTNVDALLSPSALTVLAFLPNPVEKHPEEKEHTHYCFHRSAQMFLDFQKPIDHEDNTVTAPEGMANADSYKAEDCAAMLDVIMGSGPSRLKKVPTIVRDMYQWLSFITDVSIEHRLDKTLQEMTLAETHDVVVTLLRCAPSCDRAAVTMWRVIVSSSRTAEKVLPELLCVLEDWPLHSTSTSDNDNSDVFSLAATRALWEIIHLPQCSEVLIMYIPRLFVALLFQVFSSTEKMPAEVKAFWRRCQHKHCLPTHPKRCSFLVLPSPQCPWSWGQDSWHDLGFALHTDLHC
ncbi:uncharacterized protein LOC121658393 [Corvus kubaryi]|uniref:uncharacterized protein LOC121658393 n=1 Tax=Corvus kubaryi TaxID=68294 RepID=UPI001C054148|nr:uncharacterized protein LOC121658393 [Corvus kubaryi]